MRHKIEHGKWQEDYKSQWARQIEHIEQLQAILDKLKAKVEAGRKRLDILSQKRLAVRRAQKMADAKLSAADVLSRLEAEAQEAEALAEVSAVLDTGFIEAHFLAPELPQPTIESQLMLNWHSSRKWLKKSSRRSC